MIEDAVRFVELIGLGVEMASGRLADLMELAVLTAPAGGVVGGFAGEVAEEADCGGAEGGEAGADDAGAAFDFGPDGGVDGAPLLDVSSGVMGYAGRGGERGVGDGKMAYRLAPLIWRRRGVRLFS